MKGMSLHQAILNTSGSKIIDQLAEIAQRKGFEVKRESGQVKISAPLGEVIFEKNGVQTFVRFDAPSPPELQLLKELYAARIEKLGVSSAVEWIAPPEKRPLNQTRAEVLSCKQISPTFMRMRLIGDFSAYALPEAGLHFRFLLGPKGSDLPTLDEKGLTYWPSGLAAWHRPVFTVRRIADTHDWVDVDIALHEGGRTTHWCRNVLPGTIVGLNGPSGSKMPIASRLGLFGDETAMPAILRILDATPSTTKAAATIAIRDPADAQEIYSSADVSLSWGEMRHEITLLKDLKNLELSQEDLFVFFAGERALADQARAYLKTSGLASSQFRVATYWTK